MPTPHVPLRSGRRRGHNMPSRPRGWVELSLDRPSDPNSKKLISRRASGESIENRVPMQKRRRGEPAPMGGFEGKPAARSSAYRENLSNVKRKSEARHPSAKKKILRKANK